MAVPLMLAPDLGGPGTGSLGGPTVQHNYKRAVCRPPPQDFYVDVLPPTKIGSAFAYGLRIYPIGISPLPDDKSSKTNVSGSSMHTEYDVWRRWEDCLWFQDILESEYELMARTKRQRLAAGKGVKKNGMYIHSDQAASFESLPPGPEANSIAKDIHQVIPKLTKKGTIFRASQATIDQRGREFRAMIEALFSDDVPTLVKELRETRLVRDFFGYWRRDRDHDRKAKARSASLGGATAESSAKSTRNRASIADSTTLSMYFSASTISLQIPGAPSPSDVQPSPALPRSAGSGLGSRPPSARSPASAQSQYPSSSASSASGGSSEGAPPSMSFSVSDRCSLALPTPGSDEELRPEYFLNLASNPRVAPSPQKTSRWSRGISLSGNGKGKAFPTQTEQVSALDDVPIVFMPDGQPWSESAVSNPHPHPHAHASLQALPEDEELVSAMGNLSVLPHTSRPPVSSTLSLSMSAPAAVPFRRTRNNSCPDRANRNCVIFTGAEVAPIASLAMPSRHASPAPSDADSDTLMPPTPTTATAIPSPAPSTSTFTSASPSVYASARESPTSRPLSIASSDASKRSSWRTSVASDASVLTGFTAPSITMNDPYYYEEHFSGAQSSYGSSHNYPSNGGGHGPYGGYSYNARAMRTSVATMNSFVSGTSVDAVLPRRSPAPSMNTDAGSSEGAAARRSLSVGSRYAPSVDMIEDEAWEKQEVPEQEPESEQDLLDAYFYEPGIRPTSPPNPALQEPRKPGRQSVPKEVVESICVPGRFPKPFQDRPPGQFHLPWSRPTSPPPASSSVSSALSSPTHSSTATHAAAESLTVKAMLDESIVLLRVAHASPLADVRAQVRAKFANQEGLPLPDSFVIAYSPGNEREARPAPVSALKGGRARSNSCSTLGSERGGQALRFVGSEEDWRAAVSGASGKFAIRIFRARPL